MNECLRASWGRRLGKVVFSGHRLFFASSFLLFFRPEKDIIDYLFKLFWVGYCLAKEEKSVFFSNTTQKSRV
jgi:hypothetical protein